MFIFGHMGITLAGAMILDAVLPAKHCVAAPTEGRSTDWLRGGSLGLGSVAAARLKSLAQRIDIRVLLLGSMLPDIIDKPIGRWLLRETFDNGRIFAHSLLFLALVTVVSLYIRKKTGSLAGLVLSFGVLVHLFLDAMWFRPQAFFWPLLGWSFGEYPTDLYSWSGVQELIDKVVANPVMATMALPEMIGGLVLIWFAWQLLEARHVRLFIRYGRV